MNVGGFLKKRPFGSSVPSFTGSVGSLQPFLTMERPNRFEPPREECSLASGVGRGRCGQVNYNQTISIAIPPPPSHAKNYSQH